MKKVIVLFIASLLFSLTSTAQRPKDKIVINKRPTTGQTTQQPQQQQSQNQNSRFPTQQQSSTAKNQNRVKHDFSKRLDQIELRYTVQKTGQNSKHTFYRIVGNIYSDNLKEALFSHNKRIVLFQVDNWDSGFFGDNIQSIDGYATNQQLNTQAGGGPLYQFGNSAERDFSFEFKVKNGRQPYVKAEIYPDWRTYYDYEPYLVLDYASLNGNWNQEGNTDAKFALQFNAQGNQILMKDLLGQDVLWTAAKEKTYVRQIGNIPTQNQNTNTNQNNSGTPAGGYLGGGNRSNNTSNQNTNSNQNSNNNQPNNYPSGGYLGGGNSNNNNSNNSNQNQNSNQNTNPNAQQTVDQGYSSVIEIVDRQTIKYYNSEGIVVTLVKGQ